jgi:hypothetical protein
MAFLQALLALISKSAGKILNAIFGWAVRALFGQPSPKQQPFLTGVVAAAAAWPVLLLGIALPKVAALVLAFVPYHNRIPAWVMRTVWLTLALVVPIVVGLVVAARAPADAAREPVWKRMARGWPITIALASAFFIMFVTVPALKIVSLIRRRNDEQLPLVTHSRSYDDVASKIVDALGRHDIHLMAARPSWWMAAPTTILRRLGGDAFRGYVPTRLAYFRSNDLEAALYPNGLLLRGRKPKVARAHALLSEALSHSEALQTTDANAQAFERRVHGLWGIFDRAPQRLVGSPELEEALDRLAGELSLSEIEFDDWQVIYRQLLQLDRAIHGRRQLFDRTEVSKSQLHSDQTIDAAETLREGPAPSHQ